MAKLPSVPGVLRIFIEGFIDATDTFVWGNVLHFRYTGSPPTNNDCNTIATAIAANWGILMAGLCPSPTVLRHVTVTDLTSDLAGQGEDFVNIPGTRGDDSIPANAAVLISYPSTLRFRGGHPRSYLYVLGNADLSGASKWNPAALTSVANQWTSFLNSIEAITAGATAVSSLCWVSYYSGKDPITGKPARRPVPEVFNILPASLQAQPEMASQRRRIGRRKK